MTAVCADCCFIFPSCYIGICSNYLVRLGECRPTDGNQHPADHRNCTLSFCNPTKLNVQSGVSDLRRPRSHTKAAAVSVCTVEPTVASREEVAEVCSVSHWSGVKLDWTIRIPRARAHTHTHKEPPSSSLFISRQSCFCLPPGPGKISHDSSRG